MSSQTPGKLGGFTRFEFAVAASVLGVLVATLLGRAWHYQAQAERVATDQLVGTIRTALQIRVTQARASGSVDALRELANENPFDWLVRPPRNYLGEYNAPDLADLPPGNWVFDRSDHSLVYLPDSPGIFSDKTSRFLRFKVKLFPLSSPSSPTRETAVQSVAFDQISGQVDMNNAN